MKNKITLVSILIIMIGAFSLFWIKSTSEDSWICTEAGWTVHGKPNSQKPLIPCSKIDKEQVVEKYLKENISNISPEKEVLGGKFYITKIDWSNDNSGSVEYEDGHIALKASFNYEIQTNSQTRDYSIVISNFKLIK